MQIQYILQTQQDLVERLRHEREKVRKFRKECHTFRKTFTQTNNLTINTLEVNELDENNIKCNSFQNELFKVIFLCIYMNFSVKKICLLFWYLYNYFCFDVNGELGFT